MTEKQIFNKRKLLKPIQLFFRCKYFYTKPCFSKLCSARETGLYANIVVVFRDICMKCAFSHPTRTQCQRLSLRQIRLRCHAHSLYEVYRVSA